MRRQRAELAVRPRALSLASHQRGQPLGVEAAGLGRGAGTLGGRHLGLDELTGRGQVRVHRLARDEQPHDLRGSFEDPVDAHVPHHLLGRHAPLTAGGQRGCGLVAPPAADLHQLVHDHRAHFGTVELGQRGLDADVVALVVGKLAGQLDHGLEGVGGRGDERDLLCDGLVLADRASPLHPLLGPLPGDLQRQLPGRGAAGGQRQPAGVQRRQGDLQALALLADAARRGDDDLVEPGQPVLQAAQAHKRVPPLHGDPGRVALHHERGDPAAVPVALRNPGHHHQQVGDHPVGGPELDPLQHVLRPVFRRRRRGVQPGRVGANVGLGEQERADLTARAPRQVLPLLLLGAEQRQRLRHADRLVRGQQRGDGRRGRPGDDQRPVVVQVGQAKPAVLRRDFHAERARRGQSFDHLIRDLGIPLDDGAVDRRLTELPQPGTELLAAAGGFLAGTGMRVDQVQLEVTEIQLLAEAGLLPAGLPGFLRYLACLALADIPDTSCLVRTHWPSRSLDAHPPDTARILPASNTILPTALRGDGTSRPQMTQRAPGVPPGARCLHCDQLDTGQGFAMFLLRKSLNRLVTVPNGAVG